MSDFIQDKIDLIEDFYKISLKPKHCYTSYLEECFFENGQHPTGIFNAFDLLFGDDEGARFDFVTSLDDGYHSPLIAAVDKLYEFVKTAHNDGVRPSKDVALAWYSLLPFWGRMEAQIHAEVPVTHLKFQIVSMLCIGIREPIINVFSERSKSDVQVDLLLALIKLDSSLRDSRNRLEKESGINRGTLRRLMPEVLERLAGWEKARKTFNMDDDEIRSDIQMLRDQLE